MMDHQLPNIRLPNKRSTKYLKDSATPVSGLQVPLDVEGILWRMWIERRFWRHSTDVSCSVYITEQIEVALVGVSCYAMVLVAVVLLLLAVVLVVIV